jgi:hypothetical protein
VLLLARTVSGFFALDDQVEDILPAGRNTRFTPILTLGQGMSWIHGRRVGTIASAATPKRLRATSGR